MKRRILLFTSIFFLTPIILIAIIYIGLAAYYADSFMYGVFINGIYSTGKKPEEINEVLLQKTEIQDFAITDKFGKTLFVDADEIEYNISYISELKKIHGGQNPLMWIEGLNGGYSEYTIGPSGSFNEAKLQELLNNSTMLKSAGDKANIRVEMTKSAKGYELLDGTENLLNKERMMKAVGDALKAGDSEIDLAKAECYDKVELTAQMRDTITLWKKVELFQSGNVIYDMGDGREEVIDASVTSNWIKKDEKDDFLFDDGDNLMLDDKKMDDYLSKLCDQYDTTKKDRAFLATRGEYVTVPAGTYGNKIDKKKELEYLKEAFLAKKKERHIPVYSQKAWGNAADDIGNTYIEVDLTTQKMYYYVSGTCEIETDIVTGNVNRGDGTPQKACYIYYKQRKRVLIGEDYRTPVDYWMAVYGNIGIHDAKWRRKFGGTIYKGGGSHGCINTPYDKVSKMYETAEVGTPVMIFY